LISSPAFKALISISYPGAYIQVRLPSWVLNLILKIIRDTPTALTAGIIDFFAAGDPSHASSLNALCHLYEISSAFQIPKLANWVNEKLPSAAWPHPALAFAEAMQQVPCHERLVDAALHCFDARLADMCSFHFWRRTSFMQSLKMHEVLFEEYEWQKSTHLRYLQAIYSDIRQNSIQNDPLASVRWGNVADRFLRSMRAETPEIQQTDAPESSRGRRRRVTRL
jgi:hypothetical protein